MVEQPKRAGFIGALYGGNDYVMPFVSPVKSADGEVVAIWANFADFGLVEDIFATFYEILKARGQGKSELTLMDPDGVILVDYDPAAQGWDTYPRNFKVVGQFNLAAKVAVAARAVKGETGSADATHARKGLIRLPASP